ncbi:MAG TPA: hypothetical protein VGC07_03255 [Granulicella sp.]
MTPEELELLEDSTDEIVLLTTVGGEHLAQILFVFPHEETPDVFWVEMDEQPDGTFAPKEQHGYSTLLADVLSVRRLPEK